MFVFFSFSLLLFLLNPTEQKSVNFLNVRAEKQIGTLDFPIFWLHIPKTGTSFGNTLINSVCHDKGSGTGRQAVYPRKGVALPVLCRYKFIISDLEKRWPIGNHIPLPENTTAPQLRHVVSIFRNATVRCFSDAVHILVSQQKHSSITPHSPEFLHPNLIHPSQQAKYLLGNNNVLLRHSPHIPTQAIKDEISRIISHLGFVGLTDRWDETLCLFHAKFGGSSTPIETVNIRQSRWVAKDFPEVLAQIHDPIDEVVYAYALARFEKELAKTNCRHK